MSDEKVACRDCQVSEDTEAPVTRFFRLPAGPDEKETELLFEDFFFAGQEVGLAVTADLVHSLTHPRGGRRSKRLVDFMKGWRIESKNETVPTLVPKPFDGSPAEAAAAGWEAVEHGGFLCPECKAKRDAEDPPGTEHGTALDDGGDTSLILGSVFAANILEALSTLGGAVKSSEDPDQTFGLLVRGLAAVSYPRVKKETDVHQG